MAPSNAKAARTAPPLPSLVLTTLRKARGWTGQQLAEASGLSVQMISRYEAGRRPPAREKLEALAAAMGYGPAAIDLLLLALKGASEAGGAPSSPVDPTPDELREIRQLAGQAGLALSDAIAQRLVTATRERRARKARREAARLWTRLRKETPANRRLLVENASEFQTWAFVERLCHESEDAASDRADRALELAGLALRVAELAPGSEAWCSRLQGYALAYVANARRVANDLLGAEEAFARAWKLWEAGAQTALGLLAEWRLLDLEASLHRGKRQFRDALDRLDLARASAPPDAAGRILLKKAFTLEQAGEADRAIKALREAAPLVDGEREPRLPCVVKFNLAANLCHLGRYAEAEALLPEVRELAVELRNELDMVRVLWLEGRVAAGRGRRAEAAAAFEQVRRQLTNREMAYDSALVTLELAELYLKDGRARTVCALAQEMMWIFRSQGIHREALGALQIFFEAVRNEMATAEMAQRVARYLQRAQHDPDLRFEA